MKNLAPLTVYGKFKIIVAKCSGFYTPAKYWPFKESKLSILKRQGSGRYHKLNRKVAHTEQKDTLIPREQ